MQLWLVIDWPQGQEQAYHYYLAHLHRPPQRALLKNEPFPLAN